LPERIVPDAGVTLLPIVAVRIRTH
jgi:hypothetical protein